MIPLRFTVSHGSAYTVVRASYTASQWEMTILGCQNSVTPEPIDYKFDIRDYVRDSAFNRLKYF